MKMITEYNKKNNPVKKHKAIIIISLPFFFVYTNSMRLVFKN